MPDPAAAYNLCIAYVPDCDQPLPGGENQEQKDDFNAGYRGMDEDDLLNREGLSPQAYLEFTEQMRGEVGKKIIVMPRGFSSLQPYFIVFV